MEGGRAEEELERRSRFLSGLIEKKKAGDHKEKEERLNVKVRAADMPVAHQNRAFRCARDYLDSMPSKLDSKRLALVLKKASFIYMVFACCSLFFPCDCFLLHFSLSYLINGYGIWKLLVQMVQDDYIDG